MNKIPFVLGVMLMTAILASCNSDGRNKHSSEGLKANADSLYKELIKEHNEGMNGWMKIEGRQKQIKNILDSIATLPSKAGSLSEAYKARLLVASEELANAYTEMDVWMSKMNLDSAENNLDLRIKYLSEEKIRASAITALVNNSLQKADSVLKAKF